MTDAPAEVRCLFVGHRPDPARFIAPTMEMAPIGKPRGGLWTCREAGGRVSAWLRWCRDTDNLNFLPSDAQTWRLVAPAPRLYVIHGALSFRLLANRYPYRRAGVAPIGDWDTEIDYPAFARDYDALEITDRGLEACRFTSITTYSWDVPSILWLKWPFTSIEVIPPTLEAPDA